MEGYVEKVRKNSLAGLLARCGGLCSTPVLQKVTMAVGSTVAVAAVGYGAYRLAGNLGGKYKRVRKWWTNEPDPIAPAKILVDPVYTPESARPGSEERPLSTPKCQALVGFMEGGSFCVVGNAVRMEDWLVIPDHVRSVATDKLELRSPDQRFRLELGADLLSATITIDTDLLAVELTQAQWSKIGLARASLLPGIPEHQGAYVSVVGAFGKGTTGVVSHHPVFGRVQYTGSTYQGYSGAAYMAGDRIAGIHTHGGSFNGGYSASYALCLLRHFRKVREADGARVQYEDSADWLRNQHEGGAQIEYDSKWYDMDEVRLRIGGKYHIVSRDVMGEVFGTRWQKKFSKKGAFYGKYDDIDDYEAGEALANLLGASGSSTKKAPSALVDPANCSWNELRKLKQRHVASKTLRSRSASSTP